MSMSDVSKEILKEIIGFKDEIIRVQSIISDFKKIGKKSNVAIISEPFAGKTTLINEIEKTRPEEITKFSFSSIVKNKDALKVLKQSKEVVHRTGIYIS